MSDAQLSTRLRDRFPLGEQHIGFTKLVNDLFGVESFLWHGSDLLNWLFATLEMYRECQLGQPSWCKPSMPARGSAALHLDQKLTLWTQTRPATNKIFQRTIRRLSIKGLSATLLKS